MARRVGIWIDHSHAKLIDVDRPDVAVQLIESEVEKDTKSLGHVTHSAAHVIGSGEPKHLERRRDQEIKKFYEKVRHAINGADEVVIVGPGLARVEFQKSLEADHNFKPKVRVVAPADKKFTDPQLRDHLREQFTVR